MIKKNVKERFECVSIKFRTKSECYYLAYRQEGESENVSSSWFSNFDMHFNSTPFSSAINDQFQIKKFLA